MNRIVLGLLLVIVSLPAFAQEKNTTPINVIAYYLGPPAQADSFAVEKLTHIIFSFCHLKGNRLTVDNAQDSLTIRKLVSLKARNPKLKVLLSLGGWGGCGPCSEVFATDKGRKEFALSVKQLMAGTQTDGLDLDWEYPAISGYPGHRFVPEDKPNFTKLVQQLRKTLGRDKEISFAAGGFTTFLEQSIEWKKVMQTVDRVNLMTYDLVHGYSTVTGHHTPLYSTREQRESVDNAIRYLDSIGIPRNKLVVGAAFYARIFENADSLNNGLYRPAKFKSGVAFKAFPTLLAADSGYVYHWDTVAQAPYMYNAAKRHFVTFDDLRSMRLKTEYVINRQLNGIMFWQLTEDVYKNGLLDAIDEVKRKQSASPVQ